MLYFNDIDYMTIYYLYYNTMDTCFCNTIIPYTRTCIIFHMTVLNDIH